MACHLMRLIGLLVTASLLATCTAIGETALSANGENAGANPESPAVAEDVEQAFPIEVTYHTPAQTEGPYYPVEKPADRDNDLVVLKGAAGMAAGEILEFGGGLYDAAGMPVAGAVVEIWQTDDNGAYMHPRDPDSGRRDVNFQSYGEAVTDEDGRYGFRTIMPGAYGRRPRHIHVKVRLVEKELLTTQFYFSIDTGQGADGIFAGAGEDVNALIMQVEEGTDGEGMAVLTGTRDIVLRTTVGE